MGARARAWACVAVALVVAWAAPAWAQASQTPQGTGNGESFWVNPEAARRQVASAQSTPNWMSTAAASWQTAPAKRVSAKVGAAPAKAVAPTAKAVAPVAKTAAAKPSAAGAFEKPPEPAKTQSIASELKSAESTPWAIVVGLTLLTLLPAILLSVTPMVRLLVVFHFLRQALGTQTAPSNQLLMGLALMMTWFLMQPVLLQVDQQALTPYRAGTATIEQAIAAGAAPVKTYMLKYAREKDLALFASAGMTVRVRTAEELPMQVVVPAYILSELKAGFQIGAVLFLPFLLIDMAVASITTSIGMMQLPPVVVSTPVKILLFVMVDGWHLLAGSLLKSF
jgi:flagellar biosynthetic protein FliP